ncbi:hypothetical protein V8E36_000788 [Tilletia maclaganii]
MVQTAPPGSDEGATAKLKPQTRANAGVTTRAAATRPPHAPVSDVFTVSPAAAAVVPASAAIVAALASATDTSALPPTTAAQTTNPIPAEQSMPAPATPVRAPVSVAAAASAAPAPPATPKKKKKTEREILASLPNEALIRIIEEKDAKHNALLDAFNKMSKRLDRVENTLHAGGTGASAVTITGASAAAAPAPAPAPAPTASLAQPGLSITSFPALDGAASTGNAVPRPYYSSAAASALAATPGEEARARARAALAPRRAATIRNSGENGPREVPAEALAPLFVKIARQPIRGLRQALQQLRIPTSLIHDYAFVRENTLQMIAIKDGRERLIAALRHEGIEVFDEFDPTRPRHADASSAEHEYARERFRRVAASSIAHTEKQGSSGVVRLFEEWLKRMETAHKTPTPTPASSSVPVVAPSPAPASTSGSAPAPAPAAAAQTAADSAAAPGASSSMAPEGLAELPRRY